MDEWSLSLSPVASILNSVVGGLIGLIVAYLVKFYFTDVKNVPPGPLPIPLIGNIIHFAFKGERPPHRVILDLKKKYGSIFTFWLGSQSHIVIADSKLAREALVRYQFAGRPYFQALNDVFLPDGSSDIIFSDWSLEWQLLRKVGHSAIRKFALHDELPVMVNKSLDLYFKEVKTHHGDEPYDPEEYLSFLMLSLITTINFGEYLSMDHPDFISQNNAFKATVQVENKALLVDMIPPLKYIWKKEWQNIEEAFKVQRLYFEKKWAEHECTYEADKIRDLTDAIIHAKLEAEAENSPDLQHLSEKNLIQVVSNIYMAGSETSKMTLLWVLLALAAYPKHQIAVREEVASVVGHSPYPNHDHRAKCHLLQAFLSEVMRFRPIIPLGLPHKAIADTDLGGTRIKKGTRLFIPMEEYHLDQEIWDDLNTFRPEGFLTKTGEYNSKPNDYYLPFGAGRRICPGEKLATVNLFLIVAGMLQRTRGKMFVASIMNPNGKTSDLDISYEPDRDVHGRIRPYKIQLDDPFPV